jgi:hypothetical protein
VAIALLLGGGLVALQAMAVDGSVVHAGPCGGLLRHCPRPYERADLKCKLHRLAPTGAEVPRRGPLRQGNRCSRPAAKWDPRPSSEVRSDHDRCLEPTIAY